MNENKIFKDLLILDLANNHFGDVNHAKKIINQFGSIARLYKKNCAIKFQFRDLKSYVHNNFINSDHKYVRRFLSTQLSFDDFYTLYKEVKKNKLLTACTPFDEKSVDYIEKMKFDFLKIASVSAQDFYLLERIVKNNIPKIISTGGLQLNEIDKVVSFMKKKKQIFSLMHCISIYPTANENLQISFIAELIKRYNDIKIGWSTHESPNEFIPSSLAYACGATLFERHIGINHHKYKLNNYSMTPSVFKEWLNNIYKTKEILGSKNKTILKLETQTLNSLQRGVYAKRDILKNEILDNSNIYFAFPLQKKQISTIKLKSNSRTKIFLKKNEPILEKNILSDKKIIDEYKIRSYIHELKALMNYNKINVNDNFDMEISHHKGIKNFRKTGCFLFNVINKVYAKKIIAMLPNQSHPLHFHKKKDESFFILHGSLTLKLNKKIHKLSEGQIVHIKKNSWHEFKAGNKGCIFDEISTTSYKNDSFYKDKNIKKITRDYRKTYVNNWY